MTSTHDNSGLLVRSMCGRGPPLQRETTLDMDGNRYAVMVVSAGGVHADTILRVRYRPRIDRRNSKLVIRMARTAKRGMISPGAADC